MTFLYNIDFELAAAAYTTVLYIFLMIQYSGQSDLNKEFRKLVLLVLTADIMDVVTAICISYASAIPIWVNMLLNTVYFMISVMMAYRFMNYAACYLKGTTDRRRVIRFHRCIYYLYNVLLLLNLFGGEIFYFDQQGRYLHGRLYILVFLLPLYFVLCAAWILIRNYRQFQKKQLISMGTFIIVSIAGILIQGILLPDVLLGVFTVTIGIMIMMFSLETPDYQKLMKTMDELEHAKTEAQTANQAKTEFLANMSHEVRTPINAILGYNSMIMKETAESHTVEYTANVQAAGRTLLSLVNDILDFTSIDGGKLKLEDSSYSVQSLLQDIVTYAEYNAEKKNLEFILEMDEKIPRVLSGDAVRLTQIFNNLISNAVKYTKEGSVTLCLQWEKTDKSRGILSVQIRDTGMGMKKEDIPKISGSFSRVDKRRNCNIQGLGLGLPIVIRLLDLMNSRLDIQSEYGKGSCFSFAVEQTIVDGKPIGKREKGREHDLLWQMGDEEKFVAPDARILAVDDNAMNLDLLCGLFKDTKIQIDTATNGEEALQLLKKNSYHLVLLDHMMPVLDGMETLTEIRKRGWCQGVPVIALTANAVSGAKEVYLQAGFDDYLSKPIISKQLELIIKKYLPAHLIHSAEEETEESVPVKEPDNQTGEFLSMLSFLDTETGMSYCCNSEEFYREMLQSYLEAEKSSGMRQLFAQGNWEAYRIQVHALKSTSLSIGAVAVSEQAKKLEDAAKTGDVSYIEIHHGELLEEYEALLKNIRQVLRETAAEGEKEVLHRGRENHILVVDDDIMNLRIAEKMLEDKFTVSCVKSGTEALKLLQTERPELILLDLHMPDMDGFEVIRILKSDKELKDIPVIFLTADNDREIEVKGFKEGALDFITKPFIADIMIQRINRMLELNRLQKNLQHEVEKQTTEVRQQQEKMERLSMQALKTLAGTIDAKDKYTNGHSVRVAEYSLQIARKMGMSTKEQEDIYYMGLLHDIGKIGVPDEIINKTSQLTDEEYGIIKTHPKIGADILKNLSEIPEIATGAHWHHERYDGRGYPDGLKGEEIPVVARIIGVADAYDAMTSKRSYRDILPQEVVRREIEKGRGTQFDPVFADKMLELIDGDTRYQMRE